MYNNGIDSQSYSFNLFRNLTEQTKKDLEKQEKAQQNAKILERLLFSMPKKQSDLSNMKLTSPSLFTPDLVNEQINQIGLIVEKTNDATNAVQSQTQAKPQEQKQEQLDVNKTSSTQITPQEVKTETKPLQNDVNQKANNETKKPKYQKGSSFDSAVMRYFGKNEEEYKNLSEEEKQRLSDIAFKGMIENYKKANPDSSMTQMKQYLLYVKRNLSSEEATRLANSVVNTMSEEEIVKAYETNDFADDKIKDAIQKVYAQNVGKAKEKNFYVGRVNATTQYNEENQKIAAFHLLDAKAEWHSDGVRIYTQKACEEAQNVLAQNTGRFGMNQDGTINKEAQIATFGVINESKYDSVLNTAAKNIYQLDSSNHEAAKKITYDTGCESAIKSIRTEQPAQNEDQTMNTKNEVNNSSILSSNQSTIDDIEQKTEEVKASLNNHNVNEKVDLSKCSEKDIIAIVRELKSNKDKEKFIEQYPEFASIVFNQDASYVSEKIFKNITKEIVINMNIEAQKTFIEKTPNEAAKFKEYLIPSNLKYLNEVLAKTQNENKNL